MFRRKYYEDKLNDPNLLGSIEITWELNGISVGVSVILYIGNFLIGKAVYKFGDYERHKSHTGRTYSNALNLCICLVLDCVVVPSLASLYFYTDFKSIFKPGSYLEDVA